MNPTRCWPRWTPNCARALGVDVVGVWPRKNIFGYEASGWKPFTLFDGTPCLVPGDFNVTPAPDGGWLMYPEGDLTAPPSGHMPKGGYFFDTLIRQEPIDEDHLNPEDNLRGVRTVHRRGPRLLSNSRWTGSTRMPPTRASCCSLPAPPSATSPWCRPRSSNTRKASATSANGTWPPPPTRTTSMPSSRNSASMPCKTWRPSSTCSATASRRW